METAEGEFGISIDFQRGVSDPVDVFEAMTKLLSGFKQVDRLLLDAIDPALSPEFILEDVKTGSMTSWVRNRLKNVDDRALQDFSLKKQIGSYAVKAKHKIVEYLDEQVVKEERARLEQLRDDLFKLAQEVPALRALPIPDRVDLRELVTPLDEIQEAKTLLRRGEAVTLRSTEKQQVIDLNSTKLPSTFVTESDALDSSGRMEMVLLVRKPDYLGDTQWELRHGRTTIFAHILDETWLSEFRAGRVVIKPGSALVCTVSYEYTYKPDGSLDSVRHEVVRVHSVIEPPPPQTSFLS